MASRGTLLILGLAAIAVGIACGDDAGQAGPYSALNDTSKWSTFDMTSVNAGAQGFAGAAFDGRYVYFVPNTNGTSKVPRASGLVGRYDTQAAFTTGTSWSTFDLTTLNVAAHTFKGAAFDGRYVYFVPTRTAFGLVARFDTEADFTTGTSWSTFATTTVNAGQGFAGATFDGRYVYLVPNFNRSSTAGLVTRYDTQADFTSGASWATFDLATVNTGPGGFVGAVFDGRYVYFVPFEGGSVVSIVARYDTQTDFMAGSSWATFDMKAVSSATGGFKGAAFDGRYVYFVPSYNAGGQDGVVTRYDTQAAFTTGSSWATFDVTRVNGAAKGFAGAAFDGRYVYFVPNFNGSSVDGILARYDTQAAFIAAASWSTFDMTTVNVGARGFEGAAFDGRYVYFVPRYNGIDGASDGIVARFDAKTPPALPPGPAHGSFF